MVIMKGNAIDATSVMRVSGHCLFKKTTNRYGTPRQAEASRTLWTFLTPSPPPIVTGFPHFNHVLR